MTRPMATTVEFQKVFQKWQRRRFNRFMQLTKESDTLNKLDAIAILERELPEPSYGEYIGNKS